MLEDLHGGIIGCHAGAILCHHKFLISKVVKDTIVFISGKTRCFGYIRVYLIFRILYESVTIDISKKWQVELENSLWLVITSSTVFSFSIAEALADHSLLHPLHLHLPQLLFRHASQHSRGIPVSIDGYKEVMRGLTQVLLVATFQGSFALVFQGSD
jgi:hypothetical protein